MKQQSWFFFRKLLKIRSQLRKISNVFNNFNEKLHVLPVMKSFLLWFHVPVDYHFILWIKTFHSVSPDFNRQRAFWRILHKLICDFHVKLLKDIITTHFNCYVQQRGFQLLFMVQLRTHNNFKWRTLLNSYSMRCMHSLCFNDVS